jgi:microcystin-dependent protein
MKKLILLFTLFCIFSLKGFSQDAMIGEIKLFAGNFAPRGWAFCEGQLLPISQNSALFSILGTQYGGDGRTTFALPDLRDAVPISASNTRKQGSVVNGANFKIDNTQSSTTVKTVSLRYIIALYGVYPSRN